MKKRLVKLKINDIIPYENNPRINNKSIPDVIESIKQCGYISDIVVDENNIILAGHTRYEALKRLNHKEVSVLQVVGLSDEQKKKYRILDNKAAEKSEWNLDLLNDELETLDFGEYDFEFPDNFSIDNMAIVEGYDSENDNREFFTKSLMFPIKSKKAILSYFKRHCDDIIKEIAEKAEKEYNGE